MALYVNNSTNQPKQPFIVLIWMYNTKTVIEDASRTPARSLSFFKIYYELPISKHSVSNAPTQF